MFPEGAWIVDTGASGHMSEFPNSFSSYETCNKGISVSVADGKISIAMGKGTVLTWCYTQFYMFQIFIIIFY